MKIKNFLWSDDFVLAICSGVENAEVEDEVRGDVFIFKAASGFKFENVRKYPGRGCSAQVVGFCIEWCVDV